MNRRRFVATVLAAGTATMLPARSLSARADQESDYLQGKRDVDLEVHVVEDNEHVEYDEDEDIVRFPTVMSGDEPVQWGSTPWDEWVRRQALKPAAREAADYAEAQLDVSLGSGISGGVDGKDLIAFVFAMVEDDELTVSEVAAATPATVAVTYEFEKRTAERTVAIYAEVREPYDIPLAESNESIDAAEFDDPDTDPAEGGSSGDQSNDADEGNDTTSLESDDDANGPGFAVGSVLAGLGGLLALGKYRSEGRDDP